MRDHADLRGVRAERLPDVLDVVEHRLPGLRTVPGDLEHDSVLPALLRAAGAAHGEYGRNCADEPPYDS